MQSESHGDPDNLRLPRLQRAAAAAGLPVAEAAWNIPRTLAAAGHLHGTALTDHPDLIFDCDGIIAFTAEALTGALNARFGTAYSPLSQTFFPGTFIDSRLPAEQAAWVSGLFRESSFLGAIAPDFHALDTLRDAYEAGYGCQVVTERHPSMEEATAAWLADWRGPAVGVHAVGHGNKPAWMAARYGPDISAGASISAVLMDDNPAAEITIARPGVEVWTPERPYTPSAQRPHVRQFGAWNEARYWLGLSPQP